MIVGEVLARGLREDPEREAVVARSGRLTYAELDAAADRSAAALWALGIRPGDRVAATLPNDLDVVTLFHGAMRIGAIWVGIGEALAPPEKQHLLADCGARVYLTGGEFTCAARVVAPQDLPQGGTVPAVAVEPFAPAGIAYTSGTTGTPKGIVHSQHNLLLPGAVLVSERGYGPDLRKGDCLPLTILNLQVLTSLLTAQAGGTCVVMDRRDLDGVVGWIRDERITVWNGVPTQLFDLARRLDPAARQWLSSLVELWSGGADCSDDLRAAVSEALGLPVRGTYGLTEAPTVVAMDPPGAEWRPGSSGRPLGHLDVRIEGEDGRELPAGEVGEVTVRGRVDGPWAGAWRPALGVWRDGAAPLPPTGARPADPAANAAGTLGGTDPDAIVLRTGDLGCLDADGWLSLRDRRSQLIIRGGANVYPAEVERVLAALPEVAACAVVGVRDERLGERVGAVVEPVHGDVDTGKLREACAERLAAYKVPELWAVVASLPRNGMGKIVRPGLAELLS